MGYIKAEEILPQEVIELIQEYVDGKNVYIPRKQGCRKNWGESTSTREETQMRNIKIYEEYKLGRKISELAKEYYLSEKSIQRIIREMK